MTASIDTSVREVVKAHVEEVVTEMVDQKVKDTVLEVEEELTKEKLVELLTGDAIVEVLTGTSFSGTSALTVADIEDMPDVGDFATEDYVDSAISDIDAYDTWYNIRDYVDDQISEKIQEHVDEHSHGGSNGKAVIDQAQLKSLLTIIGVNADFYDNGKLSSMSTKDSGFGAWPMKPEQGIAARLVKLEKQAAVGNVLGNGNIAADPRVDQLMAWATHVDKVLKAAAESTVLNAEVTL